MRARTAVRRAEQSGVEVGMVIASAVFERDDWTCHICGQEIPERLRNVRAPGSEYEPLAPVIDHEIALSKGGSHTLENCRAAHWRCNAASTTHRLPLRTVARLPMLFHPTRRGRSRWSNGRAVKELASSQLSVGDHGSTWVRAACPAAVARPW